MKLTPTQITTITAAIERSPDGKPDIAALAEALGVPYSLAKRMITAARNHKPKRRPIDRVLAAATALVAEYEGRISAKP